MWWSHLLDKVFIQKFCTKILAWGGQECHNSYPLCRERKLIKTEMLSKFQLNLKEKLNISNDHVEKLICDLTDKNIIWCTMKTYKYIYNSG